MFIDYVTKNETESQAVTFQKKFISFNESPLKMMEND